MTGRLVVTAFISLAVAAPVTYKITMAGDDDMRRQYIWVATAGLVAMTSLNLVGGTAQAEPLANSAAAPTPSGNEWLGRLVLIAVVAAAVGAFTALQLRTWSRRRRPPSRRSRDIYDWRTLPPPPQEDDPGPSEVPFGQQESYGPLWRYGAPKGYRRDYEPGCEPARGPGYAGDSDAGDGPDPGYSPGAGRPWSVPGESPAAGRPWSVPGDGAGARRPRSDPGESPGYGPGGRLPWDVPGDVPRDWRP
jgi:hypothetical protein